MNFPKNLSQENCKTQVGYILEKVSRETHRIQSSACQIINKALMDKVYLLVTKY
jgi:hypothetical protein